MGSPIKEMGGKRFGRLIGIKWVGAGKWLFRCDCGTEKIISGQNVRRGLTKSCGCIQIERTSRGINLQHGESNSPLHRRWTAMRSRCYSIASNSYMDYGGRGITVCPEWDKSYVAFRAWALATGYKPSLTIERIDNDGPYSPENCRWATLKEQTRNRRGSVFYESNGEKKTIGEWAELSGIPYNTIWYRIKHGWPPDRVFTPSK